MEDEIDWAIKESLETLQKHRLHIFVDVSNICHEKRVNVTSLLNAVVDGRSVEQICCVGSTSSSLSSNKLENEVWKSWRNCGTPYGCQATTTVLKRIGGKEQTVDDVLHAGMLKEVCKSYGSSSRRTIVLLSGDGNNNNERLSNFPSIVESALSKDWLVEVWSWRQSTSGNYRRLQEHYPSAFRLRQLDVHAEKILLRDKKRIIPIPSLEQKVNHPQKKSKKQRGETRESEDDKELIDAIALSLLENSQCSAVRIPNAPSLGVPQSGMVSGWFGF